MSNINPCVTIERAAPYRAGPAAGQAIAAMILLAGAVGLTAWAGRAAVSYPEPAEACAAGGPVSSAQIQAATLRVRFADAAATSAALGGSAYAAAKVGSPGGGVERAMAEAAARDLQAARAALTRLCAAAAVR